MIRSALLFSFILGIFCSCNVTGQISKKAVNDFLNDSAVRTGHAGISIYEPATGKYLYNYNAEKNFIPSSNVKLFTLYAGMKYLGDSLVGIRYEKSKWPNLDDSITLVFTSGDPTFLHPNYKNQPVFDFLKKQSILELNNNRPSINSYGSGWSWDDYKEDFMCCRSEFPLYSNVVTFNWLNNNVKTEPSYFIKNIYKIEFDFPTGLFLDYLPGDTTYFLANGDEKKISIPFENPLWKTVKLLQDTLRNQRIGFVEHPRSYKQFTTRIIRSQPTDSLLRPMMFNSDNFFAEQTLLMVSNERLGYMSDVEIIDSLLKKDLSDIPTKPRWVDGSGLSRYNLFSPKDLVYILDKLKKEFPWQRIKNILPTAGQGTLTNYYEGAVNDIYAKTGSMSNNVALSGYLITKKNKTLIFSVIINNFTGSGRQGRKAIEKLLLQLRETN